MTDRLDPDARSRLMSRVGSKNTGPELAVRRAAHAAGLRFRLHRRDIPGTPDLVFPKYRAAVFVHGCFWHGHGCSKGRLPRSRQEYWVPKIRANHERDIAKTTALEAAGWRVMAIWQCEIGSREGLGRRIRAFLTGELSDRQAPRDQLS
jgi:DNA mismatch endonuclease (patch repair protein)